MSNGKSHQKPTDFAEANVYTMTNPYLDGEQKYEVELWYQSPGDIMWATFSILVVGILQFEFNMNYLKALIISWIAGAIITFLNWSIYPNIKDVWSLLYKSFFNILVQVGSAVIGIWLIFKGQLLWGGISLLSVIGVMAIIEPQTTLYSILATFKYNMHPKYAFFKKFYSKQFPFEE